MDMSMTDFETSIIENTGSYCYYILIVFAYSSVLMKLLTVNVNVTTFTFSRITHITAVNTSKRSLLHECMMLLKF